MDAGTSNDRAGRHELAELIRNATAWWRLAADELERGDPDGRARGFAYLGDVGTRDGLERVTAAVAGLAHEQNQEAP